MGTELHLEADPETAEDECGTARDERRRTQAVGPGLEFGELVVRRRRILVKRLLVHRDAVEDAAGHGADAGGNVPGTRVLEDRRPAQIIEIDPEVRGRQPEGVAAPVGSRFARLDVAGLPQGVDLIHRLVDLDDDGRLAVARGVAHATDEDVPTRRRVDLLAVAVGRGLGLRVQSQERMPLAGHVLGERIAGLEEERRVQFSHGPSLIAVDERLHRHQTVEGCGVCFGERLFDAQQNLGAREAGLREQSLGVHGRKRDFRRTPGIAELADVGRCFTGSLRHLRDHQAQRHKQELEHRISSAEGCWDETKCKRTTAFFSIY